ncbi:SGNH/GDSL hydrolase family protein [Kribbella sp.]|uniref:SGNH/GDSL hydrolase family protein n=1 Tax=Kribbella sp. TaxID=1871183 RepID=UPI002D23D964|nr:SGNH/GDSL hydrolase family protein [Kribbella sp.]HZX03322.1 SGNH/GDSL hydrolase family protein [Kribbella sp.]
MSGPRVMFTGDSITDCHRRETDNPLGYGYPLLVAGQWGMRYPEQSPVWMNTGISGDTLAGLGGRWSSDVLEARPDVVSILIGINDTGYRFSFGHSEVPADAFRDGYRRLLEPLADVRLVLIEPFLLPVKEEQWAWRPDLDAKIQVVRELAREFGARLVAADGLFAELAAGNNNPEHWLFDGVHPTPAGHAALAKAWLRQLA